MIKKAPSVFRFSFPVSVPKLFQFLVLILVFFLSTNTSAQYAIGGTSDNYRSVYWLTWDNSTLDSAPAGWNNNNIVNGSYTWMFSPSIRIKAIIRNRTVSSGGDMVKYTPGSYSGDGLDLLYSGNNLPKPQSLGVAYSGIATTNGATVSFDIDIHLEMLISGAWTDVEYPGMIIGDAESIDANSEFIEATTTSPVAWQLFDKRTNGNSNDSHYRLHLSDSGKKFRIDADLDPGNFGIQAVMFARGARKLSNVRMKGSGITAMAIGFVIPFDLGDAVSSYGQVGNYIDDFVMTDYFNGDGDYAVVTYETSPLIPKASVYIGEDNVDADGEGINGNDEAGLNADNDQQAGNNDENTLDPSDLEQVKVNQEGDVQITVPVTNEKDIPATLYLWIDFNGDGKFSGEEMISRTVPAKTINQEFTLFFDNSQFNGKLIAGPLYARLRITTSELLDDPATPGIDERSTTFAANGETEDYRLQDIAGITFSGTVFNDGDGLIDNLLNGPGIGSPGNQQLYAYLVDDSGQILNKGSVAANGNYVIYAVNPGSYTIALSIDDVPTGSPFSQLNIALPQYWNAVGESFGLNNTRTGYDSETNLQVAVVTPPESKDVSGINFGVNHAPSTNPDTYTTTANRSIRMNVLENDIDSEANGGIAPTTILLLDPVDGIRKKSVSIDREGSYTVNDTDGTISFSPLPSFFGLSAPITYTVEDLTGAISNPAAIKVQVDKPTILITNPMIYQRVSSGK